MLPTLQFSVANDKEKQKCLQVLFGSYVNTFPSYLPVFFSIPFFPLYCFEQQIHVQQEKKMEERCFWGGETREKDKQNWIRIYMGLLFTNWAVREALSHLVMSKLSCNSIDCSPQDSSVHRISQARMLEWVPISFSRGIFPTQGLNLCLLHWQADSFQRSHQGRLVYGVDFVILKLNFNYLSIIYLILPLQAIKSNYNVSTDTLVKNVTVFKTINTSAEKQRSHVNMYKKTSNRLLTILGLQCSFCTTYSTERKGAFSHTSHLLFILCFNYFVEIPDSFLFSCFYWQSSLYIKKKEDEYQLERRKPSWKLSGYEPCRWKFGNNLIYGKW